LARSVEQPDGPSEHAAGWRQCPDGRWYPPVTGEVRAPTDSAQLTELAELINSGEVTTAIDEVVDDPELAV
jgi:hypothetical protein